ncbi:hypothetical protein L2E82_49545 [Cichorium intybus]|uniref:Uncharacterized protein n=1 Tax=Cichorium intybus TaxID=13427 RepID=A0ACB8Z1N3_CICIN|nr:hypothetical protein L2E82_49545 [Cichorium intybus]
MQKPPEAAVETTGTYAGGRRWSRVMLLVRLLRLRLPPTVPQSVQYAPSHTTDLTFTTTTKDIERKWRLL